jgi:hypothetical protein
LGYWFARTPNEKTASDQDRSEGEVAQPLSSGEAVDIEKTNEPDEQGYNDGYAKTEENKAKGNCPRGQENRTQHLVVKDVQRMVEQTEGFVD